MKKKVAKVVYSIAATVVLAAVFCMFSFSYIDLPQTPQPETGRIYPLNGRRGLVGYVTHKEKLQYEVSLGLCVFFIMVAAFTDYYADPFDHRKWLKPLAGSRSERD